MLVFYVVGATFVIQPLLTIAFQVFGCNIPTILVAIILQIDYSKLVLHATSLDIRFVDHGDLLLYFVQVFLGLQHRPQSFSALALGIVI